MVRVVSILTHSLELGTPKLQELGQPRQLWKAVPEIERRGIHQELELSYGDLFDLVVILIWALSKGNPVDYRVGVPVVVSVPQRWLIDIVVQETDTLLVLVLHVSSHGFTTQQLVHDPTALAPLIRGQQDGSFTIADQIADHRIVRPAISQGAFFCIELSSKTTAVQHHPELGTKMSCRHFAMTRNLTGLHQRG